VRTAVFLTQQFDRPNKKVGLMPYAVMTTRLHHTAHARLGHHRSEFKAIRNENFSGEAHCRAESGMEISITGH